MGTEAEFLSVYIKMLYFKFSKSLFYPRSIPEYALESIFLKTIKWPHFGVILQFDMFSITSLKLFDVTFAFCDHFKVLLWGASR